MLETCSVRSGISRLRKIIGNNPRRPLVQTLPQGDHRAARRRVPEGCRERGAAKKIGTVTYYFRFSPDCHSDLFVK